MGSGSSCDFVDEEESRTPLLAHLSERPEQGERVRMHFWALWVPLYAHDPPTICAFHRFDETVRRTRGRSEGDRKSTRLNSSHTVISYAVFCLKKKKYRPT